MKLLKFSKNTVKPDPKIFLLSICFLFFSSCLGRPPYPRDNIEEIIEEICWQEFNIEARAWLTKETLWVYSSFDEFLNAAGQYSHEFIEYNRQIFLVLQRAFLNMDKPPKFFALVLADQGGSEVYLYRIGFVPDQIKFGMGLISQKEIESQTVVLPFEKDQVIKDDNGYIARQDISLGEFIGLLIRQKLANLYFFSEHPDILEAKILEASFQRGRLTIDFKIRLIEDPQEMPDPFFEAKKIVKKYLKAYHRPKEIVEIEIIDQIGNRQRSYSQSALFSL